MLNYPAIWIDERIKHRILHNRTIISASLKSIGGICWSKIREHVRPSEHQKYSLGDDGEHELNSGFTISMQMAGTAGSAFTVARTAFDDVSDYEKVAVRAVATIALEHSQRIVAIDAPAEKTSLTPRQRECTSLVAQGKTDWEIGQIIGIGRDTVHEYIEAARKKYDVRTRSQLVLAAYKNGELNELDMP